MEVYKVGLDEVPELVFGATVMHMESPIMNGHPFDKEKVAAWVIMHINRDDMAAWAVRDKKGLIVAAMFARVQEMFFSTDKEAIEDTLYVMPDYRGSLVATNLVKAYLEWAEEQGATRVAVGTSLGIDDARVASFYGKFGFKRSGFQMVKYFG